jgi:hypothetical protein
VYSIEIKKVTREQVSKREWVQTDEDEKGKTKYGYVDTDTTEDVTRVVYTQKVEDLDLVAVINAVNKEEAKGEGASSKTA